MDNDIEQILNTAQRVGKIKEVEREDCRKFLFHIRDVAIPREKEDKEAKGLPIVQPSPLEIRFNAAKTDRYQLEYLVGDFWETMLADHISLLTEDCFTKLLQRYKVCEEAHASRNVGLTGKEREDKGLPDVLVYQRGFGLIAHIDVRHKLPLWKYPCMALDAEVYDERLELLGDTPYYWAVHNYLHDWEHPFNKQEYDATDRDGKDKWSWDNRIEDWRAIRINANTPTAGRHWTRQGQEQVRFDLKLFVSLNDMLKDLRQ